MLHSDQGGSPAEIPFTATTGVEALDRALNGLFWGDNVVFAADDAAEVEPFFLAVAAKAPLYEASAFVALVREPAELEQAYPGLEIIDARVGKRPVAAAAAARCDRATMCRLAASAAPVRLPGGDERPLGPRDRRPVLLTRLSAPARARCDRLLVAPCGRSHADAAPRDRRDHAVRARRR